MKQIKRIYDSQHIKMENELRLRVGSRIAALRKEHGLSQRDLAERSGVSRRTIQALEAGTVSPRLDILEKLAEAMEHTVNLIEKKNNE